MDTATTTKEQIKAEIDNLKEDSLKKGDLDELYKMIKDFVQARSSAPKKESLMSQLRKIKIDAPEDFSINLDRYMSGEKTIE